MTSDARDVFVARQPILDGSRKLVAYELLFRSSASAQGAEVADGSQATAQVAIDTLLSLGLNTVVGRHRAFINADLEMLASEAIEVLPTDRFVLEVLETVPAWARERCAELRDRGFEIALDDFVVGDDRERLADLVDYIKVDLMLTREQGLGQLVGDLRRFDARLLAEKVEDTNDFDFCRELGFDLYQGYFFARPTTVSGRGLDVERAGLIRSFRAVSDDRSVDEVADVLKQNAKLGLQILRIANSAGLGSVQKISSFEHAIMYIGRQHLRRWLLLLLYSSRSGLELGNPAIEIAAIRGRMLELLCPLAPTSAGLDDEAHDGAFLAGLLSLSESALGLELTELMDELGVHAAVRAGVLSREGLIGSLIDAVEHLERGRFDELCESLERAGLSMEQIGHAQMEAFDWFRGFGDG